MTPAHLSKNASIPGAIINGAGLGASTVGEMLSGTSETLGNLASSFADTYGQLPTEAQVGIPSSLLLLYALRKLRKNIIQGNQKRYNQYLGLARQNSNLKKQIAAGPVPKIGPAKLFGLLGLGAGAALGGKALYNKLTNSDKQAPATLPGGFNRNQIMAALGGASLGASGGYAAGKYYNPENVNAYSLGGGLAGGLGGYMAEPTLEQILARIQKPAAANDNFVQSAIKTACAGKKSCENFITKNVSTKKEACEENPVPEKKKSCNNFVTNPTVKKALLDDPVASLLGLSSGGFLGYGIGNVLADRLAPTPDNETMRQVLPSLSAILGGSAGAIGFDELVKRINAKREEKEREATAKEQMKNPQLNPALLNILRNYQTGY